MLQLIYASAATVPFANADLQALLKKARENNESLGVSGMLVYHKGSFLQVLEGEEDVVLPLFEKIERDDRHDSVKMLLRATVEEPSFGEWKMGFCNTSGHPRSREPGFIDFFGWEGSFAESEPDRARKALMQFREGSWRQHVDT